MKVVSNKISLHHLECSIVEHAWVFGGGGFSRLPLHLQAAW